MADLLLGIDIGTYSSKGVLCRPDGEILADARYEHGISLPKPGFVEQDAENIWWADFCEIAKQLSAQVPQGDQIVGVGLSAIGACLLPVDKSGNPLRPGILYGIDTRSNPQVEAIEDQFGREALVEFGGSRLTSQSIGAKILWLQQNEPENYNRAHKFLTSTSYIIFKLTGEFVIDAHTASEFNPLFNIKAAAWDDQFAKQITGIEKLPEVGWSNQIAGTVTKRAADETSLPEGTPVNFGAIDALSEAISVGVIDVGDLMIMYGSTSCLVYFIEKPIPSHELWLEAGAFKGQYEYTAGMSTSGSATTWFRDLFAKDLLSDEKNKGKNAYAALSEEAAGSKVGADGLLMLPYLSGERTPIFDPNARGVLAGFTLKHTRGDIYRALLEGIGFAIRMNLEAMQKTGAEIDEGVAVGGGTSNQLWVQIVSDITGIQQEIPEQTIGAAYGDAFLAGLAVGAISDPGFLKEQWVRFKDAVQPDVSNKKMYDKIYPLFRQLYAKTKDLVHQLSDVKR